MRRYRFTFTGKDQCGDKVEMTVIAKGAYAKGFVASCRKFFDAFPNGKIETSSIGEKVK